MPLLAEDWLWIGILTAAVVGMLIWFGRDRR